MATNKARRVTMSDVARHAGVSRTTVSFVLNERADAAIPEDTQARIRASIEELGYRPNAGARALAAKRSEWYGLITEIVTAPFAVDVIKGAQDRAWADGKFLLITAGDNDPAMEAAAFDKLLEQRAEGLLYATTWHRAVTLPPAAREVPVVLVNCFDADGALPSVVPDEVAGGYTATRRLIDAGHRRIGFINLDTGIPAAVGRLKGYEQALREAGADIDDTLVVSGHATADGGYAAACELLDRADPGHRPTALFCGNDRTAMGAYDAIKERGLRIPDDIAVIGFDNQELIAAYLRPGLTTVALPFEAMGAKGVDMLGALTAGQPLTTTQVTVDCPLIERSSV
ncbi:LacI family DNA-binding transcriptional regulator [Streptomyces sp. NBC_00841]|uniref:LacI family DNA-binding transcriptional regulator n=1 Tax=unclassified Streptomyces TaxID=2593676 RepID=UPI00224DD670|nr:MULTISPECIES: LacI family DNA-binding transcriptional regulator [unclassified Streptomyces]MCX4537089.1 LacI family DNA-binding transcriptional regulator [Streptomyces sp. NBC_01669]WRZ97667.1 LacI family DNA-binding transcriptional regulator [Streptomyces sp. NBC_00841]